MGNATFEDPASTIRVPQDYTSIQAAVEAAQNGDLVLVSPGTYSENIVLSGKTITLASNFHTTQNPGYIDQTIIPDAEFGCDTRWLLPGDTSGAGQVIMDEHTLPHGSTVACVAYNYDDLTDLCAEVELWIGGEKHVLDKGFWAYVPPEVSVGPMTVRNITKPVALIMSWPMGAGVEKYRGGR